MHLRLLALFLPLTAVLYIGAEALNPKGTDRLVDTVAGAIVNMLVGLNLATAASAHLTRDAAAQFLVTSFNSPSSQAFTYVYFLSEYAAPVVMGFALWRSRTVPRWLAALFTAGLEIAEAQSASGPIVILFMLPCAVAMVLLAARIWQAPGGSSVRQRAASQGDDQARGARGEQREHHTAAQPE